MDEFSPARGVRWRRYDESSVIRICHDLKKEYGIIKEYIHVTIARVMRFLVNALHRTSTIIFALGNIQHRLNGLT